jgi:hypothetical protein
MKRAGRHASDRLTFCYFMRYHGTRANHCAWLQLYVGQHDSSRANLDGLADHSASREHGTWVDDGAECDFDVVLDDGTRVDEHARPDLGSGSNARLRQDLYTRAQYGARRDMRCHMYDGGQR